MCPTKRANMLYDKAKICLRGDGFVFLRSRVSNPSVNHR
jgi:hypothetical protein